MSAHDIMDTKWNVWLGLDSDKGVNKKGEHLTRKYLKFIKKNESEKKGKKDIEKEVKRYTDIERNRERGGIEKKKGEGGRK